MDEKGLIDPINKFIAFKPEWARDWFLKKYEQSPNPSNHGIKKRTIFNHFAQEFHGAKGREHKFPLFAKQLNQAIECNAQFFPLVKTEVNKKGQEKLTNLKRLNMKECESRRIINLIVTSNPGKNIEKENKGQRKRTRDTNVVQEDILPLWKEQKPNCTDSTESCNSKAKIQKLEHN